jgi:hypothetical protein
MATIVTKGLVVQVGFLKAATPWIVLISLLSPLLDDLTGSTSGSSPLIKGVEMQTTPPQVLLRFWVTPGQNRIRTCGDTAPNLGAVSDSP